MDLEIFPRDGAGQRMVVALNKHLAISIRSGMCTGMLAWIIGQVACPANVSPLQLTSISELITTRVVALLGARLRSRKTGAVF